MVYQTQDQIPALLVNEIGHSISLFHSRLNETYRSLFHVIRSDYNFFIITLLEKERIYVYYLLNFFSFLAILKFLGVDQFPGCLDL